MRCSVTTNRQIGYLMRPAHPSKSIVAKKGEEWSAVRRLFLATVLLWCAIPLSPQTVDSDFWGHVQYGQDSWKFGVADTASYTYTAPDHRWINHENLAELIFAGCVSWHTTSLLALKCVLGCAVLTLGIWQARQQSVGVIIIAVVCVVSAINLSFYWGVRPQVFSFTCFGLLIAWTEWCFSDWGQHWPTAWSRWQGKKSTTLPITRLRGLWLVPLLLLIWANTHGGFLAGTAVFAVIMASRSFQYATSGGPSRIRVVSLLLTVGFVGSIATLANPYGWDLHAWLIKSLGVPRPEILEWRQPDLIALNQITVWLLCGLTVWGLVASKRPRDYTHLIVMALVTFEYLKHQRHLPFLVMLFLFWMPPHLQSAATRLRRIRTPALEFSEPLLRPFVAVLLGLCCLLAYRVGTRLTGIPVRQDEYPVAALQYTVNQSLNGNMVVSGHWAQYVLGVRGARTSTDDGFRVAFDGRFRTCYPQAVVDQHFDFFLGDGGPDKRYRSPTSPPYDPKTVLTFGRPDFVLHRQHDPQATRVMHSVHTEWCLLYQDELAQLWGRRSTFDDPRSPKYVPPADRQLNGGHQSGIVPFPAAPIEPPKSYHRGV